MSRPSMHKSPHGILKLWRAISTARSASPLARPHHFVWIASGEPIRRRILPLTPTKSMPKARVVRQSMNERVLVTGGAGFIGSSILRELQKLACEIFVIDNLSQGKREHAPVSEESFFQIDILDFDSVANCARAISPTWVMHLAGIHFIPYCNL